MAASGPIYSDSAATIVATTTAKATIGVYTARGDTPQATTAVISLS